MGTLAEDLSAIKTIETGLVNNKVANFAYTDTAYAEDTVNGTPTYDPNAENNIPTADPSVLKVNSTVLQRGWRAKASSITRMLMNHFLGRISYNLNKLNDNMKSLLDTLDSHYGTANGYATLDADGRIPYSQLPESALEYKGEWNASTNTPTLADGTGTLGDMYIVSVAGTQNLGHGSIDFLENDRVIYNGSVWQKLAGGNVRTVNGVSPDGSGNIKLNGEDIPTIATIGGSLPSNVSLRDKTMPHAYCKGQADKGSKICIGDIPVNTSTVFLLTFSDDNTYGSGVIKVSLQDTEEGAFPLYEVIYNNAVTSATNYGIKAGTYIARFVTASDTPVGYRIAIESEYEVASSREAHKATLASGTGICHSTSSDTVKVVEMPNFTITGTLAHTYEFLVTFTNTQSISGAVQMKINADGTSYPLYIDGVASASGQTIFAGTYKCVFTIVTNRFYLTTREASSQILLDVIIGSNPADHLAFIKIPLTYNTFLLCRQANVAYNMSASTAYKLSISGTQGFYILGGSVTAAADGDILCKQHFTAIYSDHAEVYIKPSIASSLFIYSVVFVCRYN
jgi:hypothetical protein